MEKTTTDRKALRKFGLTMGAAFMVIALLVFFRHKHTVLPTLGICTFFFLAALSAPGCLRPIYKIWMGLGAILGWVNTRLILTVVFYLIFMPIGLVMRLFGVDLLERRIDKQRTSYWKKKNAKDISDYQRQF